MSCDSEYFNIQMVWAQGFYTFNVYTMHVSWDIKYFNIEMPVTYWNRTTVMLITKTNDPGNQLIWLQSTVRDIQNQGSMKYIEYLIVSHDL